MITALKDLSSTVLAQRGGGMTLGHALNEDKGEKLNVWGVHLSPIEAKRRRAPRNNPSDHRETIHKEQKHTYGGG